MKGSAPTYSAYVDQGTNRAYPTGVSYDANGNASLTATMIYDVENRVAGYTSTSTYYGYDVQNKRIYTSGSYDSYGNPTGYTVVMYSPGGQKLGTYRIDLGPTCRSHC